MCRRSLVTAAVLVGMLARVASAQQTPTAPVLALTGITIIDGTGAPPAPDMTLVIDPGRITQLFRTGAGPVPPNARVLGARTWWFCAPIPRPTFAIRATLRSSSSAAK